MAGPDDVQVVSGSISQLVHRLVPSLGRSLDCYLDARSASSVIDALVGHQMIQLKGRGVRLRCVTEITADNVQYCKDVMKYFDLYHMPSLTGNFVIIDSAQYLGYVSSGRDDRLIVTRVPSFVAGQQFLLDNVIKNAVPARQRILEIVKGVEGEFMETIRDPGRVKSLVVDLITSTIYEVSVLFSTKSSFVLAEREGMLDVLGALSEKGIRVRILVMEDRVVKEISELKLKDLHKDVRVNYLQQFLPTKITTIVVDQSKSLVMEVNDDAKDTFSEAIGLATYSNSESTVFSNTSMFESLWIQSELDKQNKTKQVYFQMFKGFKLKDEVYNRRWSFERGEKS